MKIDIDVQKILAGIGKAVTVLSQNHTLKDQLFHNNWYPITYVSRVEKDPKESIDEFMQRLLLDNYDEIKEYCLDLLPSRKLILEESFKLFEDENYIACIPLFLIQIDGIARDYGAKGMFSGQGKFEKIKDLEQSKFIPYLHKYANQDTKRAAFFSIMNSNKFIGAKSYEELLITKHTDYTSPEENFLLNRHGILHGLIEYQDYANKLNALRAICFMVYTLNLGQQLKLMKEKEI